MSELFDSIKTSILGVKSSDIDKSIDNSFRSIEKLSVDSDRNKHIETIRNLVTSTQSDAPDNVLKQLQSSNPQVATYDQSGRLVRYNEYDAILRKISYVQRALDALTDNILSPDDLTKRTLTFTVDPSHEASTKTSLARLKKIENHIKLDKRIRQFVRSTLQKGDNFVEIVLSPQGQNSFLILQENHKYTLDKKKDLVDNNGIINLGEVIKGEITTESTNQTGDDPEPKKVRVQLEVTNFGGVLSGLGSYGAGSNVDRTTGRATTQFPGRGEPKSLDPHKSNPEDPNDPEFDAHHKDDGKEKKDVDLLRLKDVYITVHDPKFVIRLETQRFRSNLGYLVFPKIDPNLAPNASLFPSAGGATGVDAICSDIVKQLHKQLSTSGDDISLSKDLKDSILTYLNYIKDGEDLKIRYVPPDLMNHWRINAINGLFDPYGESILESINFDSRLLMALKTAQTVKQLTSATDKRVISVETGLPRDSKNVVESLKEGIQKRKISIDSMGSIDTIPSQIQTFETIYIPMRDGKKFVEIDHQQWGPDPNNDTEALKYMRDGIVANLGVPAPYVGLEENMSNRSLLTVENINFARTIIAYQKELSTPLQELFEKIYKIIYPYDVHELEYVTITFPEPKVSPYEHQMEYVEQMQRLIEALKTLDVPVEWMKKKYLPNIDWEDIEKYKAEETLKKETSESKSDDDQLAGGGGFY